MIAVAGGVADAQPKPKPEPVPGVELVDFDLAKEEEIQADWTARMVT
ncbi:hypothetical protein GCM10011583_73450 [Streptomyces camponoticapitis]|uniref:Uncharacterized protein n=1 Tax=Streptomyces camponoticapitis TaxID=1616125 RepID=A0ABQ2EXN8_9ACTN|nr:hypothetical protein [Streptomyces camponoticapitis]GGK30862.1 hypothetical protein GCM10011583_73450 [Streptomyces camponoticapitis]